MRAPHANLAPYAAQAEHSKGRIYPEERSTTRSEFQRDRDRIIHSTAFRRLEYKTQVFVNHEGDLFRTRLTHSLEVAQIGRSIARNLALNEDLVEAIALAHDLGHTPFGHAGQDALNACMKSYGGFEHNLQSLRVVDELEEKYGAFLGLNLSFETREGILKHCSIQSAQKLGDVGLRFINKKQPSLEAQLTNIADEIAYNDIDDGLRSGLLLEAELMELDFYGRHRHEVDLVFSNIPSKRAIAETIRRMINSLIIDLIKNTEEAIKRFTPTSIDDVRNMPKLVSFSEKVQKEAQTLQQFLFQKLYRHYKVNRMTHKARSTVTELFDVLMAQPELLPPDYRVNAKALDEVQRSQQARKIADYIAGMTDRFAIKEHRRLFFFDES
jgi:dGTPase